MKTAKELYGKENLNEDYFYIGDYQPILNEFGSIIIQINDNNYQGDSRILYKKEDKYGFLIFGWGSCSGCDQLQACKSYTQVDDLIRVLANEVMWFDSLYLLEKYFKEKDWEMEYSFSADETKKFIKEVTNYCEQITGEIK